MANLTQDQVDDLIEKLQTYSYVVTVGGVTYGPLKSAPKIEPDVAQKDISIYETGEELQASYLTKNNVKLTIELEDIETAMTEHAKYKKGDNILAETFKQEIILTPITDDTTAKNITFGNSYLQPGLSLTLGENGDPSNSTLTYICKADATTGKPFVYGTGA